MKHLPLKILCLLTVASLALIAGCGTNDIVNPHQNETLSKLPPPPPSPSVRKGQALSADSVHSGKIFSYADQMPTFPGGEDALMNYLHAHIRYPTVARENGIKGTVIVQFIVDKDGSLSDVHTLGTLKGGGLEEESIAVVKNMPEWIPGSEKGVKVNVQYALPIRYVLQ
jgi:TonB family protein